MRVLHITEACGAGVKRHLELVVPGLASHGVSCGVLAFGNRIDEGFQNAFSATNFLRVQPIAGSRLFHLPTYISLIRKACREWQPDIVHLHAFTAGLAGRVASLPFSPKIVYSPHSFSFHRPAGHIKRLAVWSAEKLLQSRTDAFALVGYAEADDAKQLGIAPPKLHLTLNGLEDIPLLPRAEARAALGIMPDELAAVVPCRLEPQKGLQPLLDAMRRIHSPFRLYVFGEGSLKEKLLLFVERNQLLGKVLIFPPRNDLRQLLRAFDIGLLPSFYEGLSYSLLEMLLADLPVIASDIPANHLPELQEHITYATLGVPSEWTKALDCFEERRALTHDVVLAHYSLASQLDALLNCYEGVTSKTRRALA